MSHDSWQLFGGIDYGKPIEVLTALLKQANLPAVLHESSYSVSSHKLRVGDEMEFERIEFDEYLIGGSSESLEKLFDLAQRVSAQLTTLDLRHRLEIYDGEDCLTHYLHHRWPEVV
jgi:hypothetical protein